MNHFVLDQKKADSKKVDPKKRLGDLLRKGGGKGPLLEKIAVPGYEEVYRVSDPEVGLSGVIAIHNTSLGPALGGTRIYPYAHFAEALEDALRLAKAMTYKSSLAEVGFGGGKSVILADPRTEKTPELLMSFGRFVEQLKGKYTCAEDSGCSIEDVAVIRKSTRYVVGLPHERSSGNPSPFTAWGIFRGIQSAAKKLYGTDAIEGRTVAIQGLGNVGSLLAELLFWAGARLILSDKDPAKLQKYASRFAAKVLSPEEILQAECDILSPCAFGGVINDQTTAHFRCRAIVGAANNQLLCDRHARELSDRGILYAPDFVVNAGGLLNVSAELEEEGYHPVGPRDKTHRIYDTLLAIYEIAERNRESTHEAALALAEYRLKYGIGKRIIPPTFHHDMN